MKRITALGKLAFCLLLAVLCAAASCQNPEGAEKNAGDGGLAVMTWNVQALFDGTEAGTEYDEYREAAGWSAEKYRGRLNLIAKAVNSMERKPDIIALQEIESAQVAADLAAALSGCGFSRNHFAGIEGMSLGVALLSRFPLLEAKSHSIYFDGEIAPRPILEARVAPYRSGGATAGGKDIVLFVCHWKSKLGGDDATEHNRRASARVIIRRIRELAAAEPELPVLVMGDLNENHDEFYRRSGAAVSALLPDDPRSAEMCGLYDLDLAAAEIGELQKDFIVICKNKPPLPRNFPGGVLALYTPWAEMEDGSYYYKNEWETIDHFLLSANLFGAGWHFENCRVVNYPPFANSSGNPAAYNPRTGAGLSDHLPLLLVLKFGGD